ncbi:MAG: hypothetical protein ACFFCM_16945 [Promethearchaeota archaeon]
METIIRNLETKVNRLEILADEFEKRIYEAKKDSEKKWDLRLTAARGWIEMINDAIKIFLKKNKDLAEKERNFYKKGVLKKIQKVEKQKIKLTHEINTFLEQCDQINFELQQFLGEL